MNDLIAQTDEQFGGSYEIPSQPTIDLVIGEMYEDDGTPTPGLDKLARDVCTTGERDCGGPDGLLDRAIMAVAVSDQVEAKDLIARTQSQLDQFSKEERYCDDVNNDGVPDPETGVCTWESLNLTMTLTGPVPITNAVTCLLYTSPSPRDDL